MESRVNEELWRRFADHTDEPAHEEPVIIAASRALTRGQLEATGMHVDFISSEGTEITGVATRDAVDQLATLDGVTAVDPESGEMHILKEDG